MSKSRRLEYEAIIRNLEVGESAYIAELITDETFDTGMTHYYGGLRVCKHDQHWYLVLDDYRDMLFLRLREDTAQALIKDTQP